MKYHLCFSKSRINMISFQKKKNNGQHCVVISTSGSLLAFGTLANVSLCEALVTSSEMRYWWHLTGLYSVSKFMQVLLCAYQVIGVKITWFCVYCSSNHSWRDKFSVKCVRQLLKKSVEEIVNYSVNRAQTHHPGVTDVELFSEPWAQEDERCVAKRRGYFETIATQWLFVALNWTISTVLSLHDIYLFALLGCFSYAMLANQEFLVQT